ncbi:hypothetical protein SAMN05443573_1325 [Celeribacter indicus]|nr:hypothetical protein SAMN05443573_1325 [Celeribacter indicus]
MTRTEYAKIVSDAKAERAAALKNAFARLFHISAPAPHKA